MICSLTEVIRTDGGAEEKHGRHHVRSNSIQVGLDSRVALYLCQMEYLVGAFDVTHQLSNNKRRKVSDRCIGDPEAEGDKSPGPELPVSQGGKEVADLELGSHSLRGIAEGSETADFSFPVCKE